MDAHPNNRYRKVITLLVVPLVLAACEQTATAPEDPALAEGAALRPGDALESRLTRTTLPSPELPGPPFYARTAPPPEPIFIVDGWAVIQFYRDPACIREDFNLLAFFDPPAAFGCTLLVEGFALREGNPPGVPKVVRQQGTSPVPFWFVPADAVLAAIQDGVLTIGELAALPGRIVGSATHFTEMQHASAPPEFGAGGHRNPMLSQSARGTLEDGRHFEYHLTEIGVEVRAIELRIE